MKRSIAVRIAQVASALMLAFVLDGTSNAGPLADWWLNNTTAGYTGGSPVVPITPTTSNYGTYPYNAYTGYPNTSYLPILPAGLPQMNAALLPTGGYASQYYRAPTTYYRPVTSLDPNTGTTVTSLQPCASYQYQAQRVPLLVPSWSNYAYGGYGASTLQNRWSPITAPVVGSAAGQSSLSIASGLGTYGTSPVVQIPSTGAVLSTAPAIPLPASQPITSGYGGIYYGQPLSTPNIMGSSHVVPAATWNTPTGPQQYSSAPSSGNAYSSTYGGYFGSVPQTFTQPATVAPPLATTTSGYAPSGPAQTINGITITPIGPPVNSPYPSRSVNSNASNALMPSPSYTTVPSVVSPSIDTPAASVFPPIMPSTPAPNSSWSPSSSTLSPGPSTTQDRESTIAPSLLPSVTQTQKPDSATVEAQPRFQLRSVERTPKQDSVLSETPQSPWTSQKNSEASDPRLPVDSPKESSNDLELKLNMESLRPIPPPRDFDASPEWKPALLNARDQTAADPKVRMIERQPSNASSFHEVRFLNSVR